MAVPASAEFVIVGGGAIGCGIAYALAMAGKTDVVVLERRSQLAQGTTSQGAGLCGQVRTTPERTRLAMLSARTFAALQAANAPVKPDWRAVGSLRLATTQARSDELALLANVCREADLEVEIIDAGQAQTLWPGLGMDGVVSALWCPTDGYMSPVQVAKTYEYYCRELGVTIVNDATVENIQLRNGRVTSVDTSQGVVHCRLAINAAGPHAYQVARMVDLELPIVPIRHQYFVSSPIPGLNPNFPVLRIPETGIYSRVESDGLLLGGWEENCVSATPDDLGFANCDVGSDPDWTVLRDFTKRFERHLPEIAGASVARVAKGWPTFTPDGHFIVGPSSQVPGFVMAGGCNAHGISGSPGIGQALVESLFSSQPSPYVKSLSPDRYQEKNWTWASARSQAESRCRNYYELPQVDEIPVSRVSPVGVEHRIDPSESELLAGRIHTQQSDADIAASRSG